MRVHKLPVSRFEVRLVAAAGQFVACILCLIYAEQNMEAKVGIAGLKCARSVRGCVAEAGYFERPLTHGINSNDDAANVKNTQRKTVPVTPR